MYTASGDKKLDPTSTLLRQSVIWLQMIRYVTVAPSSVRMVVGVSTTRAASAIPASLGPSAVAVRYAARHVVSMFTCESHQPVISLVLLYVIRMSDDKVWYSIGLSATCSGVA